MLLYCIIISLLVISWALVMVRQTLFWTYLVQLKEYRLNRLIDHLKTSAGKKIFLNPLFISKVVFLLYIFYVSISGPGYYAGDDNDWDLLLVLIFPLIYLVEAARAILKRRFMKPKFTNKALVLFTVVLSIDIFIITNTFPHGALMIFLDVATPFTCLLACWFIKPLDMFLRGRILRRATEKMARLKNLTVIGVTGSYGKTSTKEFLSGILATKFKVIKTPEHRNVETGIAQFIIESVNDSYDIFVCEMGGYEKYDIATIAKIIKPKIGVLTGANEQHLALFGSMDNLLSAEGGWELVNVIPDNGFIVANGANKYTREIYEKTNAIKLITTIAPDKIGDMWAENISVYPDHLEFKICSKKNPKGVEFRANLLGAQNVENILLAAATAENLGIKLEDMAKPISELKPMDKTMTLSQLPSGISLIDSSYASNPEAVLAHLEYLKSWDPPSRKATEGKARKIVIMPCLIELGAASTARHREIGERLASVADLAIITTSEHFRDILLGARGIIGDGAEKKILLIESPSKIISQIDKVAAKGDVILLEGRSSEGILKAIARSESTN